MLDTRLEHNCIDLLAAMRGSSDLLLKRAKAGGVDVCFVTFGGQTDANKLANLVFRPLLSITGEVTPERLAEMIGSELPAACEEKTVDTVESVLGAAMSGECVILIDGIGKGFAIGVQGFETRSVTQPETHRNIRGSREGFVETLTTNISLVRRRVKSPDLVIRTMKLGKTSVTDVCLCCIDSMTDKKLLAAVTERLRELPLSLILESGYVQPFLEAKNPLFSEAGATERPDVFVSKLYEGRIGVIVDGSPFALYVPKLFSENFITLDDYLDKPLFTLFIRLVRYMAFLIAILLPGFYVALANFHPELIPDALLRNLAASEALTPYSVLTECMILDVFYEIMREAGLRLPSNVGHAVSIVGGIVIGDIVVSAGLVGAPMLLTVAIASISGYIVSDLSNQISVMRFAFIVMGGLFGLFGLTVTGFIFCVCVCSLRSYGYPFTMPISPFSRKAMRDTFARAGWRELSRSDPDIFRKTEEGNNEP
ncbi:MAG: spore germination protein [Ruminiclostridium sp.]|nr:spore germination protein [Ruminiclostridium sp.]